MASITSAANVSISNNSSRLTKLQEQLLGRKGNSITSAGNVTITNNSSLTKLQEQLLGRKSNSITSVGNVTITNNTSGLTAAQQKLLDSARKSAQPTPAMARRLVDLFEHSGK